MGEVRIFFVLIQAIIYTAEVTINLRARPVVNSEWLFNYCESIVDPNRILYDTFCTVILKMKACWLLIFILGENQEKN